MKVNANGQNYDNNGFSWFAKINSETKLPANFTVQVNATYRAPTIALPSSGGGGGGGRGGGGGGFNPDSQLRTRHHQRLQHSGPGSEKRFPEK